MQVQNFLPVKPRALVCLEHDHACLYAELIEVVENRQMYWVRPLLLKISDEITGAQFKGFEPFHPACVYHDLRQGADLLWPMNFFRPAFDTEVIPLLAQIHAWENPAAMALSPVAQQHLHQFIQQLWQAQAAATD